MKMTRRRFLTMMMVAPAATACASSTSSAKERQIETIKADLANTQTRIEVMERELEERARSLDAAEAEINRYRSRIRETEARYPRAIPSHLYPAYSADVEQHNALVRWRNEAVFEYEARYATYTELVHYYNQRVDEHNRLVREVSGANRSGSPAVASPRVRLRFRK